MKVDTPFELMSFMRHKDIKTTMKFYAELDAMAIADEIAEIEDGAGKMDTTGDTSQNEKQPQSGNLHLQ